MTAFARAKYSPERAVRSRRRARSRSISAVTRSRSMCSAAGRTADMRKHLLQVTVVGGHRGGAVAVCRAYSQDAREQVRISRRWCRLERMRRLRDLGWLQFERLCALLLEAECGIPPSGWEGSADRERTVVSTAPVAFGGRA